MGWMRTLLLGDIGNRLDIADNEDRIRQMRRAQRERDRGKSSKDESQDEQLAALQAELTELELTVGAMTSLLLSKGTFTANELEAVVDAIEGGDE